VAAEPDQPHVPCGNCSPKVDPKLGQQPERARREQVATRFVAREADPIEQQHPGAAAGEHSRRHRTGRSRADDNRIEALDQGAELVGIEADAHRQQARPTAAEAGGPLRQLNRNPLPRATRARESASMFCTQSERHPCWETDQPEGLAFQPVAHGRAQRLSRAPPGRLQEHFAGRWDPQPPHKAEQRIDDGLSKRPDDAILDVRALHVRPCLRKLAPHAAKFERVDRGAASLARPVFRRKPYGSGRAEERPPTSRGLDLLPGVETPRSRWAAQMRRPQKPRGESRGV
jgi:hypothetical protein